MSAAASAVRPLPPRDETPTFGTLFSGAGGACHGLREAGFRQLWAVDNWPAALQVHARNLPGGLTILADVANLSGGDLPPVDLLWGSPPCTDFSTAAAGHRDPDRGMEQVTEYLRLVRELSPRWWVMENVPAVTDYLSVSGFPHVAVLNAADFGVPQRRVRWFGGRFNTPKATHVERPLYVSPLMPGGLEPWVSMREALRLGDEVFELRRSIVGPRAASRDIAPGSETFPVPIDKPSPALTASGARSQYRLIERPAPTVTATEDRYAGSERDKRRAGRAVGRNLTYEECAILQGFPRAWDWSPVRKCLAYKMIGNAVPPPVSKAIGRALLGPDRLRSWGDE
jgi:DNA (cytosine-5)-methyltransferase 1